MLNYSRNRSYNNTSPTSCAVSIFGLGVILTLAGIILMVITKKSKFEDEPIVETKDEKERSSLDDPFFKQDKHRRTDFNKTLKTAAPILLGLGITIIVIFFLICAIVACGKGLEARPTAVQPSPVISYSPNIPSAPYTQQSSCAYSQLHYTVNPVPQSSPPSSNSFNPTPKPSCPLQTDYSVCSTAGFEKPLLESPPSYDEICLKQRTDGSSTSHDDPLMPFKPI